MLQSMRSSAKYVFWIIAITFVGGFLLVETSGLLGRAAVTPGTTVASVDGRDVTFAEWQAAIQNATQQEQARLGRGLTADEQQAVEDAIGRIRRRMLLDPTETQVGLIALGVDGRVGLFSFQKGFNVSLTVAGDVAAPGVDGTVTARIPVPGGTTFVVEARHLA